ncbi:NAD(P)/FAD-dependent oxidoreductase [Tsukamurella sp. PLM1]|uniref:NAD(P)/FAD-dependent oxidoreductase n=1 Tax=Tsukamurella sp. PLM1 TaxID=2929795 RepID=UPI0020BEBA7A|nr:FAD-dependent oxidoreductase [Tsukamurella sp. PLM1]
MSTGPHAVIVGAGHAGFAAAAALRDRGYTGSVTLLGDEDSMPYQRPPLSKGYLLGKVEQRRLAFRPESFYTRHDITLRTGVAATGIDRAGRSVHLDSGERVPYDTLILATGARPRRLDIPGLDLEAVATLRTLADVDALAPRLAGATRLAIVGGGFIGLELAAVAASKGIDTVVLESADRLLQRSLSEPTSAHVARAQRSWGTEIRTGARVRGFAADGPSVRIDLGDDEVRADLVVVGVGAVPNVDLAADAGLAVDDGVLVDTHLRTCDPAVFAIGDCARFTTADGSTRRRESVQNATDQARAVARTVTGDPTPYQALPWFWSDQHDLKLQIAGDGTGHDEARIVGDPSTGSFSTSCYREGRLVAVESINDPTAHVAARKQL